MKFGLWRSFYDIFEPEKALYHMNPIEPPVYNIDTNIRSLIPLAVKWQKNVDEEKGRAPEILLAFKQGTANIDFEVVPRFIINDVQINLNEPLINKFSLFDRVKSIFSSVFDRFCLNGIWDRVLP